MAEEAPMSSWLGYVGVSLLVSVVTFWGLGGCVHYWFYVRRRHQAAAWKLQPGRWLNAAQARHALWLGSVNLVGGALLGASFAWYLRGGGWSLVYFDAHRYGALYLPIGGLLHFVAIDAGLYYSHRALHHRALFRHVHRWHHRYIAPTVFTTTAMHPVDFLVFFFFLVLPAFVIPVHVAVYVAVIFYTYFIGMVDHVGVRVRWRLPLHASNQFHDDHHQFFHCNYGHHTLLFDRLHGTVRRKGLRYDEHTFHGAARDAETVRY
jgi:lathosterol oxidase